MAKVDEEMFKVQQTRALIPGIHIQVRYRPLNLHKQAQPTVITY